MPQFQRNFSWTQEEVEELWQDIEHMRERKTQHFMGYLVLQSQDDKAFEIVDGQQRITTIMLLIIAALARFEELIAAGEDAEESKTRKEHYHDTYLGLFDAVTIRTSHRLKLNINNHPHFKDIVTPPYRTPHTRNLTPTNRELNKTLDFFKERLKGHKSKELAELIKDVTENLLFTTITVNDDLDAFLVFETLNARGVHLAAPDLLKNYLLSRLLLDSGDSQREEAEEFEGIWSGALEELGAVNFTSFLRSYEGMSSSLKPTKQLYRSLKETIKEKKQVMPYLKGLKEFASVYAALQNPDDPFWLEHNGRYSGCIEDLKVLKLFSIKTPLSLLMIAHKKFSAEDFIKTVRYIVVVSIRYNVICGKVAKEQEKAYNKLAIAIYNEACKDARALKEGLMAVYPKDDEFFSSFAAKQMPSKQSKKKISYLLRHIEKQCSGNLPSDEVTLEHVLPASPSTAWQESFGVDNYNNAIDRLGNIALLSESQNMGQESFEEKKAVLANTSYDINKNMAEHDKWNMESVNQHQNWLAQRAKTVWRIE